MLISYWETESFKVVKTFEVVNTACDRNGQILILDTELNDSNILLINFYNSNSEPELSSLQKLLVKSDDYSKKKHCFFGR